MNTTTIIVLVLFFVFGIMIINTLNNDKEKENKDTDKKETVNIKKDSVIKPIKPNKIILENIDLDNEEYDYAKYISNQMGLNNKYAVDIVRILKVGITYGSKKALETFEDYINDDSKDIATKITIHSATTNLMEKYGILEKSEAERIENNFTAKILNEGLKKKLEQDALRNS